MAYISPCSPPMANLHYHFISRFLLHHSALDYKPQKERAWTSPDKLPLVPTQLDLQYSISELTDRVDHNCHNSTWLSKFSRGCASSAKIWTVESALIVTEPLLAVKKKGTVSVPNTHISLHWSLTRTKDISTSTLSKSFKHQESTLCFKG